MADRLAREFRTAGSSTSASACRRCARTTISATARSSTIRRTAWSAMGRCRRATRIRHLVNAGKQNVTLRQGASIVHHADSFAMIRGGHLDVRSRMHRGRRERRFRQLDESRPKAVPASAARWILPPAPSAFRDHGPHHGDGSPRLVERCAIAATARGVATLVRRVSACSALRAMRSSFSRSPPAYRSRRVKAATGCAVRVPPDLPTVRLA